ncbi:MAG: hypothetical protein GXX95_01230 [Methanomassiliicoccus sp.]|nr:hypothetical protein [Methanomassiliicoccus sp.]
MTNWIEKIQSYIIEQGAGTVDNVFRDLMPDDPVVCMALFGDAGEVPEVTFDGKWILHPGLQVQVRDTDSDAARARLDAARAALTTMENVTISGVKYLGVKAMQEPMPLGTDESGAFIIGQNFLVLLSFDAMGTLAAGTKFYWNGAEVAEILSLGDLIAYVDARDVSYRASPFKEYKPGKPGFEPMEIVGTLRKEGGSLSFFAEATSGVIRPCEVRFPSEIGLSINFDAFVSQHRSSFASILRFSAMVHPTGRVRLESSA